MAIYSLQPVARMVQMTKEKKAGLWLLQPAQEDCKEVETARSCVATNHSTTSGMSGKKIGSRRSPAWGVVVMFRKCGCYVFEAETCRTSARV